jgi:hypothetical protein
MARPRLKLRPPLEVGKTGLIEAKSATRSFEQASRAPASASSIRCPLFGANVDRETAAFGSIPNIFDARTKRQILTAGSVAARRLAPKPVGARPLRHFAGAAAPPLRRVHSSRS